MNCPHCNKELILSSRVLINLESYGRSLNIAAPCCKKPLYVSPKVSFSVDISYTTAKEDDWGTQYAVNVK